MHYEMALLEGLVSHIRPSRLILPLLQAQKEEWMQFVETEKDRICVALNNGVFKTSDSKIVELYIQQHQRATNALANTLLGYMEAATDPQIRQFYTEICACLESLLSYILKHFDKYFDVNLPVPQGYRIIASDELRHKLEQLESNFARMEINKNLVDIALKPIREQVRDNGPHTMTYRTLNYYQELMDQLSRLDDDNGIGYMVLNLELIENILQQIGRSETRNTLRLNITLLYINFNSPEFVAFCIKGLLDKYNELPDSQHLWVMELYLKFLSQIRLKPSYSLIPEEESVTQQIKVWLEHEISFLQKKTIRSPEATANNPGINASDDKIRTALSTRELVVYISLFAQEEVNIIVNKVNEELYRAVAEKFTTVGSDELSIGSIKSKKFNLHKPAIESVLHRQLESIKVLRRWLTEYPKISKRV